MRNLFILLLGGCFLFGGCAQEDNFFEKLKAETPPNLISKPLYYYGVPIANLEFSQYLARDYDNAVDTGYIALKITNLGSQSIDSLGIAVFLYPDESQFSNSLEQAKKEKIILYDLTDSTRIILFKKVPSLKKEAHIEVFCTKYNDQNQWSNYYTGQVEPLDTITATLFPIEDTYGVITADHALEFRLTSGLISTQQIKGKFTSDFNNFVGSGYNDAGDITALLSLDTLVTTGGRTQLILNYKATDPLETINRLTFLFFD